MKKYQFNKLIRSKLPERMGLEGVNIVGRHLNDEEYELLGRKRPSFKTVLVD